MNGGGGHGGPGGADNFAFEMDMPKSPWRYPHLMFRADSRKAKGVSFKQDANQVWSLLTRTRFSSSGVLFQVKPTLRVVKSPEGGCTHCTYARGGGQKKSKPFPLRNPLPITFRKEEQIVKTPSCCKNYGLFAFGRL